MANTFLEREIADFDPLDRWHHSNMHFAHHFLRHKIRDGSESKSIQSFYAKSM